MAIVTIDGHIGAGAADLGKRIAELLGCDFYDRLLVVGASKRMGARLEAMIERQRRASPYLRPALAAAALRVVAAPGGPYLVVADATGLFRVHP